MLNKIKKSWKSLTGRKCLFCGEVNEEDSFKAEVKIPGWKGMKEKYFCSSGCLEAWEKYAKERGKVKCSSCCSCRR
jgi:hypothetical protein